jgi:hypothetical protein
VAVGTGANTTSNVTQTYKGVQYDRRDAHHRYAVNPRGVCGRFGGERSDRDRYRHSDLVGRRSLQRRNQLDNICSD